MLRCVADYTKKNKSIVNRKGTDPDAKMNCFTWSIEENDWIVPWDQYNEELNNWQGPIHNGKFCLQTLKEKKNIYETYTKYSGSAKFNGIPRELIPKIPIKSYKDQCREHMIRNIMWDLFSLPEPRN